MFTLPKPQTLHQKHDRDCGVCVFAALVGISEGELVAELPHAAKGEISVDGWRTWLEQKGFVVTKHQGCPTDVAPCAHLVANAMYSERDAHWVFRDADGDVLDPSPVFTCMPADDARMRDLSFYSDKILTITISK